ncbi:MAG: lysine--tRNA ligase [Actinomycetota bacterium]|nr:lysine--tRNA ligase [Actinomycetota bacterium]
MSVERQTPYPYRYERTATADDLHQRFSGLEPGGSTGYEVQVAGRVMSLRSHGKVAFADLKDATGHIQLFAQHQVLGDSGLQLFLELGVGDIVGVSGEVVMTRRGELSIKVGTITLLAPCLRPWPEKWHGMTDVETRYRQRYLDLNVNPSALRPLEARAAANAAIRSFLGGRGFIEVETPLLQPIASGAIARPFTTHHNALDIDLSLRIAPELYLKRVLIGGIERVYELNRSFRNEGVSTKHNPEFTMLEGYEAYVDYEDTMDLVEALVREIASAVNGSLRLEVHGVPVDLAQPFRRLSMFEAIAEVTDQSLEPPWRAGDADGLRSRAVEMGARVDKSWPAGKLLAEIYEQTTEGHLEVPTFVVGHPTDVSPLAKAHRTLEGFTEHADLVIGGVEMAPVYSELNDPVEQRRRFEEQVAARAGGDEEAFLPDEEFLEALSYGMPPAGGFGLGIDRLLTMLLGLSSLREVILFPTLKPEQGG